VAVFQRVYLAHLIFILKDLAHLIVYFVIATMKDNIHVLIECPKVVQAWHDVNLWDKVNRVMRQDYNIYALIFSLLQQFS
jgi:hypothetical protein